jgi:hypothetical protein
MIEDIKENEEVDYFLCNNKIAIYSCNFGNYRNELCHNNLNLSKFENDIDYYFYTDDSSLKSDRWNIILTETFSSYMDEFRSTSKFIKFILPKELEKYDIVIWLDNKCLPTCIKSRDIATLFVRYKYVKLFNLKHPIRNTIKEELDITISYGVENNIKGNEFHEIIKDWIDNIPLSDTCKIIRVNDNSTKNLFKYIYELLNKYQLKRDQNIYTYGISKFNDFDISQIYFLPFDFQLL